ncbi:uncharacterized protein [Periplaneta americana]|uniref:uncharacterized protein n=1 Tax=Periplaneta americana TaxID=6978 RepID=UPI0037E86C7C
MIYSIEQRLFMYDSYIKHKSFVECRIAFIRKYPGVPVPSKSLVRNLVAKFRATGSVLDDTEEVGKNGELKGPDHKKKTTTTTQSSNKPVSTRPSRASSQRALTLLKLASQDEMGSEEEDEPSDMEAENDDGSQFTFVEVKHEAEDNVDKSDEEDNISDSESSDEAEPPVKDEPLSTSSDESSDSENEQDGVAFSCVKVKFEGEDSVSAEEVDGTSNGVRKLAHPHKVHVKEEPEELKNFELSGTEEESTVLPTEVVTVKQEVEEKETAEEVGQEKDTHEVSCMR